MTDTTEPALRQIATTTVGEVAAAQAEIAEIQSELTPCSYHGSVVEQVRTAVDELARWSRREFDTANERDALAEQVRVLTEALRDISTTTVGGGGDRIAQHMRDVASRALAAAATPAHEAPLPGCPECGWNDEHSPQCTRYGTPAPQSYATPIQSDEKAAHE